MLKPLSMKFISIILSRVRGSVTNNNVFWSGWLNLLALQSMIRAYSHWLLSKTRSIAYWTTSVLSSTVTDLVLIYESVTSSAATALNDDCLTNDSNRIHEWTLFYNFGANRICHHVLQFLCYSVFLCLFIAPGTYLQNRWPAMDFRVCSLLREHVLGRPLASNGLPLSLHYSGFQASCHNIYK
jgi:hypothetical protein